MEKYLGIILIAALAYFAKDFLQQPAVLGESTSALTQTLPVNQPITTQSSFTDKLEE